MNDVRDAKPLQPLEQRPHALRSDERVLAELSWHAAFNGRRDMDIRRILVVDDYTQVSTPALAAAIDVGRRFEAELLLLHAWQLPDNVLPEWVVHEPGDAPQPIYVLARKRATHAMEVVVREARLRYAKLTGRAEQGDPEEVIVSEAARGFDLVVMATHGRSGLSHLWNGSVAERVLRRAVCPVLTVHAGDLAHA